MEDEYSRHGIGAVHQRGGSLQDLYGMDSGSVYLYTVLISPLLAFLADAVVNYDDTVVPQATDDRFRDGGTGGYLRHAGLPRDSADNIGRCPRFQFCWMNHRNGRRHFVQMHFAGKPCNNDGIQFQMFVKYVCGIYILLCVHHCTHAQ